VTICAGGSATLGMPASGGKGPYSYLWSPSEWLSSAKTARPTAKPDSTTTYLVTVTDSRGCSSQDSVTVRVLTRILVDAGPDHSICPGEQVRIGGVASSGKPPHVYSWVPSAGLSNPKIPQPLASPGESTVYVLTVTDANGCTGQDSVRVLVNRVVIADAGPDVNLCEGGRARIGKPATGGSPPYKYVWTPAKGLSDASAETPYAAPSAGTRYILTVADALGCMDRDTVTVAVNSSPRVKTDPDFSLCRGSRRKISASVRGGKAPFHYEWAPRRGLSAYDVPNPIASPDTTTVYTVTATDANGCSSSDTLVIIVRPCSRSDAGPDVELCLDGETELGGAAADPAEEPKYLWTPSTGLNADNILKPRAKPGQTTTYFLRVTNMYGCESQDTVTITVHPRPSGGAGPPVSFCEGGRAVIGTEASGGLPPYSYSWEPTVGLSEANAARPIAEPSVSTEYTLTVTDAHGCSISDKVQVTVLPRPAAEAGPDKEFCSGGAVNLGAVASGGRGPFTYDWKPAFGLDNPSAAKPRAAPAVTTTYHLIVTNSEGCLSEDSVTVTVHAAPRPVLQADGPTTFCDGGSVILDPGEDYAKYRWSDGSESRSLQVRRSGTYMLTAFEEHGCSGASAPVTVKVLPSPRPRITARGPLKFCEGESVTLDAGPGYASYRWSTGEEARTIEVRNSGIYAVTVANKEGCSVCSDSLTVAVHPRPVAEVTRRRDTLSVTPAASSYQWLAGGKPVRGAQRRQFIARESGSYSVMVKNENGCAAVTAPAQVVFGSAAAVLPRKTVRRGRRVDVPLELASVKDLERAGARAFEAVIRVKKKELTLLDTTIAAREEGGDLLLTLRGAWTPGSRVLATIPFIAGERPARIPIVLESFKWLDGLARATTRNGEIRVLR